MKTHTKLSLALALAAALAAGAPAGADDRDLERRIDRLLVELGDDDLAVRAGARAELLDLGERARNRLVRASGSLDFELAREAEDLLAELDERPFDFQAFLDSVWMPTWIRPMVEDVFRDSFREPIERTELPPPAAERTAHRCTVRDTMVNGERTIVLDRDGTEYTFRLHRDGSIEGRVECGRSLRTFEHSSRESLRRRDPELFEVLDGVTRGGEDPAAKVHDQVREVFEKARSGMPSDMPGFEDFDSQFRRIEREARRGLGR